MGLMERLRASTKYIFWLLLISFGVLWGLSDTRMFDALMAGPRSLGEVDGQAISYEEYNARLQNYLERYRMESGGEQPSLELRAFYEDMVWDELVMERILDREMDRLGITVTDAEIQELAVGENPHPLVAQYFTREDGTIDRAALAAAVSAPENAEIWIGIEAQLREVRRREKLNAFLEAGLTVTDEEVRQEFRKENSTATVRFVRFPYAEVDDATITVTDAELNTYLKNNAERFEQPKTWNFRFVSFSKAPTADDVRRTLVDMSDLRADFAAAENDSAFLAQNASETGVSAAFQTATELGPELAEVFSIANGQTTEPVLIGNQVVVLKRLASRGNAVRVARFTRTVEADAFETVGRQAAAADDFAAFADDSSFEEEAQRSGLTIGEGTASAENPLITGVGQSRVLLKALERAKVGQISDPVELDDRFIVFEVTSIREKGTRPLEDVRPQVEALVRQEKKREATLARLNGLDRSAGLDAFAAAQNRTIGVAEDLRANTTVLPGAGVEPAVVGAAFAVAPNTVSGVIAGENAAFVIEVVNRTEADLSTLDAGRMEQMRMRLQQAKAQQYRQVWIERLKESADIRDYRSLVLR